MRYDFFDSPPICPLSLPAAKEGAVFINPDASHRAGAYKGQNPSHLPSFYTKARRRRRNVPYRNNILLIRLNSNEKAIQHLQIKYKSSIIQKLVCRARIKTSKLVCFFANGIDDIDVIRAVLVLSVSVRHRAVAQYSTRFVSMCSAWKAE